MLAKELENPKEIGFGGTNIPFLTMIYGVLTFSISPKDSEIISRIGVVVHSEPRNILYYMFPRDYKAPNVP